MSVLIEACVTSPSEAEEAVAHGARRVELCRDLEADGLTPGSDLLRRVLDRVGGAVPVFAMVRPTAGPHTCPQNARGAVLDAIRSCVRLGAQGIVTGFLELEGGWPDLDLMAQAVEAAAPAGVTFHKAFDQVRGKEEAAVALGRVGVARILTAGGPGRAVDNLASLEALVEHGAAGRGPEIIVAGGVRGSHVKRLVDATGAQAVHARSSAIPGIVRALRVPAA